MIRCLKALESGFPIKTFGDKLHEKDEIGTFQTFYKFIIIKIVRKNKRRRKDF